MPDENLRAIWLGRKKRYSDGESKSEEEPMGK